LFAIERIMEWYFSIVDVCKSLSDTDNARRYWSDLKWKLKAEGSELYEKIVQLKMKAEGGKSRLTDVAGTEQLLCIIQSIIPRTCFRLSMGQLNLSLTWGTV